MSNVIIKECKSYKVDEITKSINDGIEKLGGWEKFIKPNMKVLLKVNLIGPKTSDSAAITHCEFVRSIVRILKSKECEVWIGDSSGGAIAGIAPTKQSFIVSGLNDVALEEGAIIKNFDKEGVIKGKFKDSIGESMYLAKPIYDADLVINLPKLKTHTAGIYTGAVKNMFGAIPGLKKAYYHKTRPNPTEFGEYLVDIYDNFSNIGLHIMDGIVSMEGEGPTAGNPYKSNKILISEDPLALDTVALKMLGIDISSINILKPAIDRKLGEYNLESIRLEGDYSSIPLLDGFVLPKKYLANKKTNYNALKGVINFLKTRPNINLKKCIHCNTCVDSCPVNVINVESKRIDYENCIECMCCHELCMHKAIDLKKVNFFANLMTKVYRGKYR